MKKFILLFLFVYLVSSVSAQRTEENRLTIDFAWYPANLDGYEITGFAPIDYSTVPAADFSGLQDGGRDLGGQAFEAQVKALRSYKIPWLRGTGPLTSGNNIEVQLQGELSPVSLNTVVRTRFTPLAVLTMDAALSAGTGWSLGNLNGLALNTAEEPYDPTPLGGFVLGGDFGVTAQFDLGAVVPGDWTHLLMLYRSGVEYRMNTSAEGDEPWQWLADSGENYNGWNWSQTALLGYATPALKLLDTAGFLLETSRRITNYDLSPMDSGGWGSDFLEVFFGPVVVLKWGSGHSMNIQMQFARERDYTDGSVANESFIYREVDTVNPTYWYFRRVAMSYSRAF